MRKLLSHLDVSPLLVPLDRRFDNADVLPPIDRLRRVPRFARRDPANLVRRVDDLVMLKMPHQGVARMVFEVLDIPRHWLGGCPIGELRVFDLIPVLCQTSALTKRDSSVCRPTASPSKNSFMVLFHQTTPPFVDSTLVLLVFAL